MAIFLQSKKITLTPNALIHPQTQSILFSTIPPEIRNIIFIFSLDSYIDEKDLYDPETHYTRPGYEGERTYPTNLLWTCKRIYLETHHLPLTLNGQTLTFYFSRPPPDHLEPRVFFPRVPSDNLSNLTTVCLNVQQVWLEASFATILQQLTSKGLPALNTLRIVIRHGDWWYWERNNKLGINPYRASHPVPWHQTVAAYHRAVSNGGLPSLQIGSRAWGAKFSMIPTLEKVEIEFETLTSKRDQLDLIVDFSKYWRFPMPDGKMLVRDETLTEVYGWNGPVSLIVDNPHAAPVKEEEIKKHPELAFTYQVRVATWRKC